MARTVNCIKLKREAEGLDFPPYPGPLGKRLFESLLALRNDVGLLAEEYDPRARRQLGNFPQAFSHVALVATAHNLMRQHGPVRSRAESGQAEPSAEPAIHGT